MHMAIGHFDAVFFWYFCTDNATVHLTMGFPHLCYKYTDHDACHGVQIDRSTHIGIHLSRHFGKLCWPLHSHLLLLSISSSSSLGVSTHDVHTEGEREGWDQQTPQIWRQTVHSGKGWGKIVDVMYGSPLLESHLSINPSLSSPLFPPFHPIHLSSVAARTCSSTGDIGHRSTVLFSTNKCGLI